MTYLRSVTIGMAIFAMAVSFSGAALAEMGYGACKGCKADKEGLGAQVIVLKDSAAALQVSNPTLAKGLTDLADKKADDMQKWQDMKDQHAAKVKLLQDAATALETSNPALAKELKRLSEKKSYMEKEKAGE
ncbi:MAG: hypothetical protein HQL20_11340 [Candidatus Omnitrophica bacterium]|nr:hypothetical protein [Candidatus Omnitrophota bacterium]